MLRAVANAGKWKVARAAAWSTPTLAARPSAVNIDHPGGLVKPHISEGWTLLRLAPPLSTGCSRGAATSSVSAAAAAANGLPFRAMPTPTAWGRGQGKIGVGVHGEPLRAFMTRAGTPKMRNLSSFAGNGGRGTSLLHSPKPHGARATTDNAETKTTTVAVDMKHRTLMASLCRLTVAAAHIRALAMEWILRLLRSPKMSLHRLAAAAAQMRALAMDMEWLMRLLLGPKTSPERLAVEAA
ncbi:hypothetical protein E2562_007415 [Oryza meyeriana var. granulata]|uniref:Uncharacterized protein n=1 Tax=Oryza meyeriana var. granulata TaxID=110450 RepID=A0A6G1CZS7_9ORYZ|nr:hypothetical protein E2562_007415 [Oryza meyeriana var. granulata]